VGTAGYFVEPQDVWIKADGAPLTDDTDDCNQKSCENSNLIGAWLLIQTPSSVGMWNYVPNATKT
jgi:hypothetical protein